MSKQDIRELNKLRRRYGWQPTGLNQKSKKKHELVDDREASPRIMRQMRKEQDRSKSGTPMNEVFFSRRKSSQY